MYHTVVLIHVVIALFSLISLSVHTFQVSQRKKAGTAYSLSMFSFVGTVLSGLSLLLLGATARKICPALGTYTLFFAAVMVFTHFIQIRQSQI